MRFLASVVAWILLGLPSAVAQAQGYTIGAVSSGPALQEKTEEYGERDVQRLLDDLRDAITDELGNASLLASAGTGPRIDLVLVDASPNRPTFAQLGARPGLSFESFSLGGAEIEALIHDANGNELDRVRYEWHSTEIRDAQYRAVWSDAQRTINRFAARLANHLSDHQS